VDTNWNQSQNTNVVTIKTKLSISNNKEFITDFDFTESFNAVGDKLTQVSGIEELSSCGVSIFRYWESFEQIEDVKSSLTGWIVIVKTGHITKDNLIEFKFDNLQQENRILLFKGRPALIIKTNTIKL
jgi:hypothetical protein